MNHLKQINLLIWRSRWTLLFIIIVVTITLLFSYEILKIEVFLVAIGGAFTAYLGILRQAMDDDKVFKELFISFNARYTNQTNELLNKLKQGQDQLTNDSDVFIIIDYFNLCSEEYLWYKKGRIPFQVWKAWEAGIIVNLSIPIVREIFNSETKNENQRTSYYGFVDYISPKIK